MALELDDYTCAQALRSQLAVDCTPPCVHEATASAVVPWWYRGSSRECATPSGPQQPLWPPSSSGLALAARRRLYAAMCARGDRVCGAQALRSQLAVDCTPPCVHEATASAVVRPF
ncbi:unnamed protein product [Plutella xylostella]|uniref:(diamondback moth) hypothetical protein n=1 Tax=Plutella xylostella TaxID=51655 RepID=A0A8S4G2J8_PLUXY|nr:unnamed protein product [Plutella xylostella]